MEVTELGNQPSTSKQTNTQSNNNSPFIFALLAFQGSLKETSHQHLTTWNNTPKPTWVSLCCNLPHASWSSCHHHASTSHPNLLPRLPVCVHPASPKVPQRVHGCLACARSSGAVGVLGAQDVGDFLQQLTLVGPDGGMALLQHLLCVW